MARDSCVTTAAVRLMLLYPFWCELYYSMKIIESEEIPTLATNGQSMWVNPKFWDTLSLELKVAALAHETCHKMLHHCTRGRNLLRPWDNIAMDIVVNTMLHENGFKIGATWVQPEPKYSGWTFEAVYADITKDLTEEEKQKCKGVPGKYDGAWDDVQPFEGTPEEIENFEEKVEQAVQQALEAAKAMGNSPVGVDMAMKHIHREVEEKWFDYLRRYFQSMRRSEYNWAKTNRRTAVLYGVVAPELYSERLGKVVLFTDASGSCWDQMTQSKFGDHTSSILSEAQPEECHVAYFDTIVHKHVVVDPGQLEFEPCPAGGGGTSIAWMAQWLEEKGIEPAVVIVLTDMYIDFPKEAPPFPVIWASTTPNVVAPFGETIYIK